MTSETDATTDSASTSTDGISADAAAGGLSSRHPNFGRITAGDAGDSALAAALQKVLDGAWSESRAETRAALTPELLNPLGLTMEEQRDHTLEQL